MSPNPSLLSTLRRRGGQARQFAMDYVCDVTRLVALEAECNADALPEAPGGVKFRPGSSTDLAALSEDQHEYSSAAKKFSFERLRRGDTLTLGESGGEIVFYSWLMYEQMDVDIGLFVPMTRGRVYSYKAFTVQHARGRGIFSAYYRHIKWLLRAQGYERVMSRIVTTNASSIHVHLRAGFQPVGHLWKLVLGGKAVYWADANMRSWLPSVCPPGYFNHRGFLVRHEL